MKTIIMIAGIYAVAEIAFHLGEGYAFGYVTKAAPEVGKAFHDHNKAGAEGTQLSWYRRMMLKLVLAGEEIWNIHQRVE